MSVRRAGFWITGSIVLRLLAGLLTVKVIALVCGPQGLGQLGQLMSLIAICVMLAAGGVQNGLVTSLPVELKSGGDGACVLGAAAYIGVAWSVIAALVLLAATPFLAQRLLGSEDLWWTLVGLASVQGLLALAAVRTGELNGRGNSVLFAKLSCAAVLIGMCGLGFATWRGAVPGAAAGLIWSASCPAIVYLVWGARSGWALPKPRWNAASTLRLGRFGVMLLVSAICLPLVQIALRDALLARDGWVSVGHWQAVLRISEANLQFVTVMLSSWFLPRLTVARCAAELNRVVRQAYTFVLPMTAVTSLFIALAGEWVVRLLFSHEFSAAAPLLSWQMLGDCLRAASMVLGFVGMSRGHLGLHVAAESFQALTLLGLGYWWIADRGSLGAVQAYAAACALYLPATALAYLFYIRHLRRQKA